MSKQKATIYDVAAAAGVATATVSRVINGSSSAAPATRKRVLLAIEELQFRPDRLAKALAEDRAHTLAIATPTFTTPFHNELLKGVKDRLRKNPPPTAVFASSDVHAIGAIKAIQEAGFLIPDDMPLIGYDDIKTSAFIELSSVNQRVADVGFEAADVLLQRVCGDNTDSPVANALFPELQVRGSSMYQRT